MQQGPRHTNGMRAMQAVQSPNYRALYEEHAGCVEPSLPFAHLLQFSIEVEEECDQGLCVPCCKLQVVLKPLTETRQVFRNGVPQGYLQSYTER